MNAIDRAYASGMESVFVASGMNKTASHRAANIITGFAKQADMFNFSDFPDKGQGFQWSKIVIPLLAALASGTLMYNVGMDGSKFRSAYENTRNYIGDKLSKIVRTPKSPSMFSNLSRRGKW